MVLLSFQEKLTGQTRDFGLFSAKLFDVGTYFLEALTNTLGSDVSGNCCKIYNSLIRMNKDGSRATSFNASLTGTVRCIVTNDDMILAGGSFEAADGIARQGLVRYQQERHYVSKAAGCGGKSPCYTSIQAALNVASDGAAIMVGQGDFDETPVKDTEGTATICGGWNDAFTIQTSRTTRLRAPAAPKGAVVLQEVVIIP